MPNCPESECPFNDEGNCTKPSPDELTLAAKLANIYSITGGGELFEELLDPFLPRIVAVFSFNPIQIIYLEDFSFLFIKHGEKELHLTHTNSPKEYSDLITSLIKLPKFEQTYSQFILELEDN